MDLEFGVFDWVDVAKGRSIADTYDDRIAVAQRADRGRFERYHIAEHHGATLGLAASPGLFAAAVARQTQRIRLAPMTFVVPLYEPLRLVEEIAMIDQLSHGRLELGIGKGSSPIEARMFGLTADQMRERYEASLPRVIEALKTGVYSNEAGEAFPLSIRPVQSAFTTWYPTSNPDSIRQAALNGQNTIFGFAFRSPGVDVIRERRDIYFDTRAGLASNGRDPRFGVLRHVCVAATEAQAWDRAEAAFADHYDNFTWLWRQHGVDQPPQPDLRQLVADHLFFVGSPDDVTAQVAHVVEATGVNYVAGAFSWGSLSVADALTSIDLFDTQVIPAVLERVAG
ncbi:LLM class flavin-dependent oxidoreductase [Microbacterium terrisoli]|uniref:LLM class flavin-dependent oxidoreductase n=1 Tax=Microbacterium terrisoli TaxID=3242192 RepID=UPI0028043A28|nr:LLM class flavin-dependent oxidoreductase [Microbacterium protaetiae]